MNIFKNTVLFSTERLLRTGLSFIVSILITKSYGIEIYGEYAYYFAIINILGVAFSFGLDDYFVKCTAENHKLPMCLLHIRVALSGVAFIFCCLIMYLKQTTFEFWIIALLSLTYVWNCFYLLLIVMSKNDKYKSVLVLIGLSVIFLAAKFVAKDYSFIAFMGVTILETIMTTVFLYVSVRNIFNFEKITINDRIDILKNSFPIGISSLSVILYYRLDQMIVEHYLGVKVLGTYALSASMLLAAGYFQSAYVTGMYSAIGSAKKEGTEQGVHNALLRAYRGAICIGLFMYLSYFLVGRFLVNKIFPEMSVELISLLNVGMISIMFSGLSAINSQYLFFYNHSKKRLIRTLISLLFNILWNVFLIPKLGVMAAVWGYVITQVIMAVLFNAFDKTTRVLLLLQLRALFTFREKSI